MGASITASSPMPDPSVMTALSTPISIWVDGEQRMTLREYLRTLLERVWVESEGFSGKRPFGDGSWQHDLERALLDAGATKGKRDGNGYISYSDPEFDFAGFIVECIRAL